MTTIANILLLVLGFAGAVTAFCGDTLRKEADGFRSRITRTGWWSLGFLAAALSVGIWKEVLRHRSDSAQEKRSIKQDIEAKESADARRRLERDLAAANAKLSETTSKLNATATQLTTAQAKLDTLEPVIVGAMYKLTERIPRESDFAFVNLDGLSEPVPISSETTRPLRLFGGDEVEYHILCSTSMGRQMPSSVAKLALRVGRRDYPLSSEDGILRIAGPIGEAMTARVLNPTRADCGVKLIVKSTDRRRMREQFAPILAALQSSANASETQPQRADDFFARVIAFVTSQSGKPPESRLFKTQKPGPDEFIEFGQSRVPMLFILSADYDAERPETDSPVVPSKLRELFFTFLKRQGFKAVLLADKSMSGWENKVYRAEKANVRESLCIQFEAERNPSQSMAYAMLKIGTMPR